MAQMVKNLPPMWETWVQSLGWEDPLEKGRATHSSILAWRNSMDCIVHGVAKSQTRLSNFHFTSLYFTAATQQMNGGVGLVTKSCPTLASPWTVAHQAPPSMEFRRQEYWSGLPFPSSGDLPNPGIEPKSPTL